MPIPSKNIDSILKYWGFIVVTPRPNTATA